MNCSLYNLRMRFRIASTNDLAFIEGAYAHARAFMQANGNAAQWPDGYPSRIDAEEDIWLFAFEGVGVVGGVGRVVAG